MPIDLSIACFRGRQQLSHQQIGPTFLLPPMIQTRSGANDETLC